MLLERILHVMTFKQNLSIVMLVCCKYMHVNICRSSPLPTASSYQRYVSEHRRKRQASSSTPEREQSERERSERERSVHLNESMCVCLFVCLCEYNTGGVRTRDCN